MQIAVFFQLLWVIGSIFWNLSGLDIMENGEALPTPTPSWITIFILFGIGCLLVFLHYFKFRALFRLMSLATAVFAAVAIYEAFLTDPELWVNSTWQWVGVFINLFGLFAGLFGVFGRTNHRGYRPDPISPFFNNTASNE
jgi:predicted ferric reductase